MTIQSRVTLKSYFITGSSPSESEFGDLIDSALLVGDIVNSLSSTSTTEALSASLGKTLNDSISSLLSRVVVLENQELNFASSYYDISQIDSRFSAVDTILDGLALSNFQSQIDGLQTQINNIDVTGSPSSISISNISGLQSELNLKASIAELSAVRDSLILSINSIETEGVDLTSVNSSIATISTEIDAIESQLLQKANTSDIPSDYYTKSQVDNLVGNVDVEDHKHVSADITDLGSEIQAKTNILVQDHSTLQSNPHNVTKAQIGLSKVENLTPAEMVAQGGAIEVDAVQSDLDAHKASSNPHNVSKSEIGLGDVPNINFQLLLDQHISAENPHNIDLSYFDVYAKAEADARTQFYIDSVRYAFTPLSNGDSAGAVGDFAYDSGNLYFKIGPAHWSKIPFSPVYIERESTQQDVDAGRASTVGELITVNEVAVQNVSEITINQNFNITNEGDDVFQITNAGNIIQNATTIEGDVTIQGDINSAENITINAPSTTVNNLTSVGGSITNLTQLSSSTASLTNLRGVSNAYITDLDISKITTRKNLTSTAFFQSDFKYDFDLNRWTTNTSIGDFSFAYLADVPDLSEYAKISDIPSGLSGTTPETNDGATSTDIVLESQTGGQDSGYAKGDGLYADDLSTPGDQEYWSLDAEGIQNTGIVINIGAGSDNPFLRYDITINEWVISNGTLEYTLNPYTQGEVDTLIAGRALINHAHSEYVLTDSLPDFSTFASVAALGVLSNSINEVSLAQTGYALTGDLPDFSTFALLTDLEGLGNTTIINEGDTVVNETIIQQGLTIDAQTGGAENGYAFDEGAGLYAEGTGQDVDEEYWSVDETSYGNTGLTIDVGMDANPSLKFDISTGNWVAFDGAESIVIGEAPDAYTKLEADARYLQSIPSSYLTEAEGDAKYLQSIPSSYLTETEGDQKYYTRAEVDQEVADAIAALGQVPTQQDVIGWIVAANEGTLVTPEYSMGAGGNYSLAGTASSPWSGWDQNDDYAHAVS